METTKKAIKINIIEEIIMTAMLTSTELVFVAWVFMLYDEIDGVQK
jgi:hypothetical protein